MKFLRFLPLQLSSAFFLGLGLVVAFGSPALASSLPSGCNYPWLDWVIEFLPSSPDNIKLANVLTEFALEAPIGSGIIFEAYSLAWGVLSTMAFFKGLKLLAIVKFLFK